MPQGKGTYGSKKGRPPKRLTLAQRNKKMKSKIRSQRKAKAISPLKSIKKGPVYGGPKKETKIGKAKKRHAAKVASDKRKKKTILKSKQKKLKIRRV